MRRPLAVLILVLGALASLLFALNALFSGDRTGTVATSGPIVRPVLDGTVRPRGDVAPPLETAEDISLVESRTAAPVELAEDRGALTGIIRGRVVDPQGAPIRGALVSLLRGKGQTGALSESIAALDNRPPAKARAQATTGGDGLFTFQGLEADDEWGIKVTHEDYNAASVPRIDVPATGGVEELVRLHQGMVMTGMVRAAQTLTPIPHAKLLVENPLAGFLTKAKQISAVKETETDEFGRYELKNIPGEHHTIRVEAPGYATLFITNFTNELRQRVPAAEEPTLWKGKRGQQLAELAQETEANRGEPIEWNFDLQPGLSISGRVIGPDQGGVSGVRVSAINQSGSTGSRGETLSSSGGEFLIPDLGEGVYTLQAEAEGYQSTPLQRVEVGSTGVEMHLARQGGVSGRVVDAATGRAVSGFTVRVRTLHSKNLSWGGEAAKKVERDRSDGSFSVGGLPKGDYVAEAYARGYASSFSEPFFVEQGVTTTDVVVRLTKGGTLKGAVADSYTGQPIVGATVGTNDNNFIDSEIMTLLGSMGSTATSKTTVKTDEKGEFLLELLTPDVYQVKIDKPGYTTIVLNDVRVDDGVDTQIGPQRMVRGALVAGTVLDVEGDPVPGAQISMRPTNNDYFGSYQARSDANGRYVIRNARGGEYMISASRPQTSGSNPFAPVIDIQHSEREVNIVDGGSYDQLDLRLPAQSSNN